MVPSASGAGCRAPAGSAVSRTAAESGQRDTCGRPVGPATKSIVPAAVHAGSAPVPARTHSPTPEYGAPAGQPTTAQCPAGSRAAATQRPSGEGTIAPHVVPGGSGTPGSVGWLSPAPILTADSTPPPAWGSVRRAP